MDLLGFSVVGLWEQWIGPILQLIIGFGLVIFVHELGHFLAARWTGMKVERFVIGFGPRLFGIKRGETDYRINVVPIGGYVKVVGQEDFAPLKREEKPDPRSYEAKPIGARFVFIAAGVAMNVIFAAVLFIIVGLVSMDFPAPVIGSTKEGYPASEAELVWRSADSPSQVGSPITDPVFERGLRAGDVVLSIDGEPVTRFSDLMMKSILAPDADETYEIVVRRIDGEGREWIGTGTIGVKPSPDGKTLVFGLSGADDVVLAELRGVITDSPFREGDRVVAIDGKPIEHQWQIPEMEKGLDGREVSVTIERSEGQDGTAQRMDVHVQPGIYTRPDVVWGRDGRRGKVIGTSESEGETFYKVRFADGSEEQLKFEQLAGGGMIQLLDIIGLMPRLKVAAVTEGSPADDGGVRPGDIVVAYGDHGAPTLEQFHRISERVAGTPTELVVLRDAEQQTLVVRPEFRTVPATKQKKALVGITNGADIAHTVVASVREGSPAQTAGLMPGDVIEKISDREVKTWVDVLHALKQLSGERVSISYRRSVKQGKTEIGLLEESAFSPGDYEVRLFTTEVFKPLMVTIHKPNPIDAVLWGAGETWDFIIRTYATLRALVKRTVSTEALTGPVGIARIAVQVGREQSIIEFIYLMAFISACIAVINFLPLPVLDGGHALFLLIEMIRRKPVPLKVMKIAQTVGLVLILLAFLLLTWQDIAKWWENP